MFEALALLAAAWAWTRVVGTADGGRDRGSLHLGLVPAAAAAVATRPWRSVPGPVLALAATVPLAAFGVCALAPAGWGGLGTAAAWAYASALFVAVAGFARSPARVALVALAVALASFDQFGQGWLAWWGGADPSKPMIGTLLHYNPFGGFLVPGAVVAFAAAMGPSRIARLAGWTAGPFLLSGIVFSTSRGSGVAALLGMGAACVALLMASDRRRALAGKAALFVAVSAAVAFALTGPPVFAERAIPIIGVQERGAVEGAGQNATYRSYYWQAAVGEFADRPLVGGGFGSFGQAAPEHLPYEFTVLSLYAHNGLLQAFSDGGLLFGVPVLAAVVGLLAAAALSARRVRRVPAEHRWAVAGLAGAAGALIAHSLIDFDWAWPSLLAMAAVVGGGVAGAARATGPTTPARRRGEALFPVPARVGAAMTCAALAICAVGWSVQHDRDERRLRQALYGPESRSPESQAELLADGRRKTLSDPRMDAWLIKIAAGSGVGPGRVPWALAERAADEGSARIARIDATQAVDRGLVLVRLGREEEGLAAARAAATRFGHKRPGLNAGYAAALAEAGREDEAVAVLAEVLDRLFADEYPRATGEALMRVLFEISGTGSDTSRCAYRRYLDAYDDAAEQPVPVGLVAGPAGCRLV